jgi:hypothetical protein
VLPIAARQGRWPAEVESPHQPRKEAVMPFGSLALPGLVSAVAVFVVSALVHMVLRYHRADYRQLADEEPVSEAIRRIGPAPGVYALPHVMDPSRMKDPAVQKRYQDGPVALLTVLRNGPPAMGKYLAQWFLYCLLASFVVAYLARHTLSYGTSGLEVMRITGAVAFTAYAFGYLQDSIWQGIPWSNSLRGLLDAALYALTTGLVFRLLWPAG